MHILHTNGEHPDFIALCQVLDATLDAVAGGKDRRADYIPYNQRDDLHDVLIAYDDAQRPTGCAALRRIDDDTAEVKRVFVHDSHRCQGFGTQLMTALENLAKAQGYHRLILETGEPLTAAMQLYQKLGYTIIPGYGPYATMDDAICMMKEW